MKRIIYTMVPLLFCINLFAQKDYFIFIQNTSGQPFYVRMGEKSFSSSVGGHIILAGLKDSSYNLYIGFPKNIAPEQLFIVPVHLKDRGFELKYMNGEWQLFDLQALQLIKPTATKEKNGEARGVKKTDSYSQLMAGVVNDTAVLYAGSAGSPQEQHKDTAAAKMQETIVVKEPVIKEPVIKDTVAPPLAARTPVAINRDIIRYASENLIDGKLIIYIDRTTAAADTIRIIIPRL